MCSSDLEIGTVASGSVELAERAGTLLAEIVQNLSLMVAFLDWIKPTAGNYKLCRPLARVIRRVLDQVFEPAAAEVPREKESLRQVEMADDTWSLDNMDDLEWLNSIDWTSSQYIDFN